MGSRSPTSSYVLFQFNYDGVIVSKILSLAWAYYAYIICYLADYLYAILLIILR